VSAIDLETLLKLVGPLDDSGGPNSASARFRTYIQENIREVGDLRAYVEAAVSSSGDQYNKALQDLVNHMGSLLGFEVEFGRYRGVAGEIGFDGLWQSPTDWVLVVETKTTDVYSVKTSTILGYINGLVSAGRIKRPDQALGLYIYGRFDAGTSQLEKAIMAEKRQEQLRVVSVDALLNLLELKQEYDLEHQTIMQLVLPSSVRIDVIVNLLFDITAQERRSAVEEAPSTQPVARSTLDEGKVGYDVREGDINYYLLPAADSEDGMPVLDNLHHWLDRRMWGFGQRTGYRKALRPGDRLCFYAARIGVVAECKAASPAFELARKESPKPKLDIPYGIRLKDLRWFEDAPIGLTTEVRAKLSAFQDRDLSKGWAWFVQGTSKLTQKDFELLTGRR
jgi:hypothetical protein